jgi:hypothetical protein
MKRRDEMTEFGVHSEVGKLRTVMVHRPELSLQRLTPSNHDELLFDDVLWVERAQFDTTRSSRRCETGASRSCTSGTCSARPWPRATRADGA